MQKSYQSLLYVWFVLTNPHMPSLSHSISHPASLSLHLYIYLSIYLSLSLHVCLSHSPDCDVGTCIWSMLAPPLVLFVGIPHTVGPCQCGKCVIPPLQSRAHTAVVNQDAPFMNSSYVPKEPGGKIFRSK